LPLRRAAEQAVREDGAPPRELPALVEEVGEGVRRASAIIDNLQNLIASPQQGHDRVDMKVLAQEALARAGASKGAEVELVAELDDVPAIQAAPSQLEQVVGNLLDNALRAVPARGVVRVKLAREGTQAVRLEVRDDGVGMSEQVRRRATEPFFTTRPVGQGTGLGLAIVQSIVASLKGTLSIESAPGAGTTVTVRLPAAQSA
jgi:signal transduction histidine kinase